MRHWLVALAFVGCGLSGVQAETHVVHPIESARTSPDSCWGCCCGTGGSLTMNPGTIDVKTCTYQGGYCMGDAHKGAWIFQIPEMVEDSEITYMRFTGGRSGSWGTGYVYYKWMPTDSMSQANILDAMNDPDHYGPVSWNGASTYSFSVPESIYAADSGGYLMVAASFSSTYTMNLTNTGTNRARLVFLSEVACPSDFDSNGSVDVSDVLALLGAYGSTGSDYDLDGDNYVGVNDLLQLLDAFGDCP